MTNYEKLFQSQMQDPQFAKAYREARLERILNDFLENLKEKISQMHQKGFAKYYNFDAKANRLVSH